MNATSKQITKTPMTTTIKTITACALLVLAFGMLSMPFLAQDHQGMHPKTAKGEVIIGKKAEVHFTAQVKAGDAVLKPGMYQVQHVMEGGDHVIVFKEMGRIKCKVEPVTRKVSNTKITLRTNAAGEKEIAEVQVAGETFKHLM